MDNLVSNVISAYNKTLSLKATAAMCEMTEGKARKILLSNNIVPDSLVTKKIMRLHESGMSSGNIATELNMTAKAVNAHLPYANGMYRADGPSKNAMTIRKHRGACIKCVHYESGGGPNGTCQVLNEPVWSRSPGCTQFVLKDTLGNKLRTAREEAGLSLKEAAAGLELSKRALQNWESDMNVPKGFQIDALLEWYKKQKINP